jgi:hypothetical protein
MCSIILDLATFSKALCFTWNIKVNELRIHTERLADMN